MSAFLYRLGRRCAAHPFRTLGVWLLIVLAVVAANGAAGGDFSDDFRLPGSESQRAKDDLEARFAPRRRARRGGSSSTPTNDASTIRPFGRRLHRPSSGCPRQPMSHRSAIPSSPAPPP